MDIEEFKQKLQDWKSYQPRDEYDLDLKKSKINHLDCIINKFDEYNQKEDYFLKFSKTPAPMQEFFKTNNRFYIILDSVYYLDEGRLHQVKRWSLIEATKTYTLINFWIERKDLIPYIGARRCAVIDVAKKIPAHQMFENCIGIEMETCIRKNPLLAETKARLELMQ